MRVKIAVARSTNGRYLRDDFSDYGSGTKIRWVRTIKKAIWFDADGNLQYIVRLMHLKSQSFSHIEVVEIEAPE
jgi:hypothetical protein